MAAAPWPRMRRDLVAILRGLKPEEAHDVVMALVDAGLEAIEIPLNSPDPFNSIEIAVKAAGRHCLIGAGTVLTAEDADRLAEVGGRLFVSPNVEPELIARAARHGMVVMPGVFTPSEALAALAAGASGLKFFPASVLGPSGISAIRAVLPPDTVIAAVGGVGDDNFADYAKAGIRAFGLGSSLYKPGASAAETARRAGATLAAYDRAFGIA
jgi:2-dehydro-3-deoxyphosphogalactonate aldolase